MEFEGNSLDIWADKFSEEPISNAKLDEIAKNETATKEDILQMVNEIRMLRWLLNVLVAELESTRAFEKNQTEQSQVVEIARFFNRSRSKR